MLPYRKSLIKQHMATENMEMEICSEKFFDYIAPNYIDSRLHIGTNLYSDVNCQTMPVGFPYSTNSISLPSASIHHPLHHHQHYHPTIPGFIGSISDNIDYTDRTVSQQQPPPPCLSPELSNYQHPPSTHQHHHHHHHGSSSSSFLSSIQQQQPTTTQTNKQILSNSLLEDETKASSYTTMSSEQKFFTPSRVGRRCKAKEDKHCGVCGDKALSCNFDAISCESCKAFFRRNASKGITGFKCHYTENCVITVSTRRLCKKCRIKKCFEIGMKKEYIMSCEERQEKKIKIKQNKIIKMLEERGWVAKDLSSVELAEKDLLTEFEISLIDEIIEAYNTSLTVKLESRAGRQHAPSIVDLINLAEISILRAIEMFKGIKAFRLLKKNEQIVLLKSGSIELLILRGVLCYDPLKERFLDVTDNESSDSLSLKDFMIGAGGDASVAFQRFTNTLLSRLQCCQPTMLLLLVICLFSDRYLPPASNRPSSSTFSCLGVEKKTCNNNSSNSINTNTSSPSSTSNQQQQQQQAGSTTSMDDIQSTSSASSHRMGVDQLQGMYCRLLKRFLATKYSKKRANRLYPQIMMCLPELRVINEQLNEHLVDVNINSVTPLMTEMLDIPPTLTGTSSSSLDDITTVPQPNGVTMSMTTAASSSDSPYAFGSTIVPLSDSIGVLPTTTTTTITNNNNDNNMYSSATSKRQQQQQVSSPPQPAPPYSLTFPHQTSLLRNDNNNMYTNYDTDGSSFTLNNNDDNNYSSNSDFH